MPSSVRITRLGRGSSHVLSAEWNGRPVAIRMDNSAILKLQGNGGLEDLTDAFSGASERISLATQRLLEMRQTEPDEPGLVVVISALDLD